MQRVKDFFHVSLRTDHACFLIEAMYSDSIVPILFDGFDTPNTNTQWESRIKGVKAISYHTPQPRETFITLCKL